MDHKKRDLEKMLDKVVDILKNVYDPEIPVNIYDLGLIYELDANKVGVVDITMTLTSPACPVAESLPLEIEQRIADLPEVTKVNVNIVWDPPWEQDFMSDDAKLELGLF